jgi:hypothetical protein
MPKDCPHCGLVNPTGAQRCDCGYDFQTKRLERSYLEHKQIRQAAAVAAAVASAGGAAALYFFGFRIVGMLTKLIFGH